MEELNTMTMQKIEKHYQQLKRETKTGPATDLRMSFTVKASL